MKAYKKRKDYIISASRIHLDPWKGEECVEIYNYLYGTTSEAWDGSFLLVGPIGEHHAVTLEELTREYTFADGCEIMTDNIPDGAFEIVSNLEEVEDIVFAERITGHIKVGRVIAEELDDFAWFEVNKPGIPHGKGDYIVYPNNAGQPDLDRFQVINGAVFEKAYDKVKL